MSVIDRNEYIDKLRTIWGALVRRDKMTTYADAIIIGGN